MVWKRLADVDTRRGLFDYLHSISILLMFFSQQKPQAPSPRARALQYTALGRVYACLCAALYRAHGNQKPPCRAVHVVGL